MSQHIVLPEGSYATCANGYRIHYLDEGEGPVVVLLHGSGPGASAYSNFKQNYPFLVANGFRCLVVDLPGFGYSDKPEDVVYSLAFFVECVAQMLDAVGVSECVLFGNSLGGAVAIGLALERPGLVEALVLLAPGGMSERDEYLQMPGMQKMFEIYAGGFSRESLRELFSAGLVYDPSLVSEELLDERLQVMEQMNAQVMTTLDIPYLAPKLSQLSCPSLVFWGANERMMPDSGILAMAHHCPRMKFLLLSECGHWVMLEHEDVFNRECLSFLHDLEAGH